MLRRTANAARWRSSFLNMATSNGFSYQEGLRAVLRRGGFDASALHLFMRRLRRSADGSAYFSVADRKLFFLPDGAGLVGGEALGGAILILKEAFLGECDFFSGEVVIRPGDTVLDLGGNIGTSALLFSGLVGDEGRVFSFEPVFHDVLERNLRENGVRNASAVPLGVADAPGTARFDVTDRGIDSRLAHGSTGADGGGTLVTMTTLDEFVGERNLDRVDFIKMDIEGAEELALRGGTNVLARFRPKLSIASYHTDPSGDKQHPKIVRFLKDCGYRVHEVGTRRIYAWHPDSAGRSFAG